MFVSRTSRLALVSFVAAMAVGLGGFLWTKPMAVGLYYFTSPAPQRVAYNSPAYLEILVQQALLPDEVVPALRPSHRKMMQERCEPTSTFQYGDVALCNTAKLNPPDLDLAVTRFGTLVDADRSAQRTRRIRHFLAWMIGALAAWAVLACVTAACIWIWRGKPASP